MQANGLGTFVQREDGGMFFNIEVNKTFTTSGDGYWSNVVKDVFVNSISMFIVNDADEGDGDLAISFAEETWDNDVDGLIYTDTAFLQQVKQFLIDNGFNADAVNAITYSEQGMQDYGRVSCDAFEFADYVRNTLNVAA